MNFKLNKIENLNREKVSYIKQNEFKSENELYLSG